MATTTLQTTTATLPFIDTSAIADPAVAQAVEQFNADLQGYLTDLANTFGLLNAPNAYAAQGQQPIVASAFSQWTNQAYQAQICSALDGGTAWFVERKFLTMNRYLVVGKTLFWHFGAAYFTNGGGTLTGSPFNLRVLLPADLIASNEFSSPIWVAGDNNNVSVPAMGFASGSFVTVSRNDNTAWSTSAGIAFMAVIELA